MITRKIKILEGFVNEINDINMKDYKVLEGFVYVIKRHKHKRLRFCLDC